MPASRASIAGDGNSASLTSLGYWMRDGCYCGQAKGHPGYLTCFEIEQTRRPCPDGAALVIKGEHFPCDGMRHMHSSSESHDGWAHSNADAEAIWQ